MPLRLTFRAPLRTAVFLSLFLVSLIAASASEFGGIGGNPAHPKPEDTRTKQWFIYTLAPGESVEDELLVKNTTNREVTVKLYPADYVQSTDGGFALDQEVEPRDAVGAWVELSETQFVMPPSSQTTIPFKITVPNDPKLDVGDHMGGILIQEVKEAPEGSGGIQLSVRTGVRIYITIPGEIKEDIQIEDMQIDLDRETRVGIVTSTIVNKGNVGKQVTIKTDVDQVALFLNRIFPRLPQNNERIMQVIRDDELISRFEFDLPWIAYARFSTSVEYSDLNGNSQVLDSKDTYRWILPPQVWLVSTLAGLGALVFFFVLFIRSRFKRRSKRKRKSKR